MVAACAADPLDCACKFCSSTVVALRDRKKAAAARGCAESAGQELTQTAHRLLRAAASGQAPCRAGVPAGMLAVIVSGELRQLATSAGRNILAQRIRQLGRDRLELFLHVGAADTKAASGYGGVRYRTADRSGIDSVVRALAPVWWRCEEVEHVLPSGHRPCASLENQSHRSCAAEDRGVGNRAVGCYADDGQRCSHCDARKYWKQFGRLLAAFYAIVAREEACRMRFGWIMRLRTDAIGAPRGRFPLWPAFGSALKPSTVHVGGLRRQKSSAAAAWAPADMFAMVPRDLADGYFSLGLTFLQCQPRARNGPVCGNGWDWATPECIYKVHLHRCVGLERVVSMDRRERHPAVG